MGESKRKRIFFQYNKEFNIPLKNSFYFLKIIWEASPKRVICHGGTILFSRTVQILYNLFFIRYIIESMESNVAVTDVAMLIAGVFIMFYIEECLYTYINIYLSKRTDIDITEYLMNKIYKKAIKMDLVCYENPKYYDSFTRANEEVLTSINYMLHDLFYLVFFQVYGLIVYSIMVIIYEPIIFPIVLVLFMVSQQAQMKFIKAQYERRHKTVPERRRMDYLKRVVYQTEYVKDLRMTNIFESLVENFKVAAEEMRITAAYYGKKAGILRFISSVISSLSSYLVIQGIIIYRYMFVDAYSFATLVTVMNAASGLDQSIAGFTHTLGRVQENEISINNYLEFLRYESTIVDDKEAKEIKTKEVSLVLKNVTFKYDGSDIPVIKNINMNILKGQKIALVGHNGAGKSTLAKLLMRLYDPTEGHIYLNGENIRKYSISDYRNLFGTVFQDFKLFAASVSENVVMDEVNEHTDRSKITYALKETGIYNKINKLPIKTDSILTKEFNEDGVILSGGEGQKLAVCRSFIHDNPIAILDEPSSALDPISEHNIFQNMLKACENKTVIFVSHRLSSATLADRVYMMEKGQIIEEGSHMELMAMNGKYAKMFNLQSKNYRKKEVFRDA